MGSSQKEVGLRGAKASVKLIETDVALGSLDTTVSHNALGIIPSNTMLGKGVANIAKNKRHTS